MTNFDFLGFVGRLEFHICADKTPSIQYFRGTMTNLLVTVFNKFFGSDKQSQKFCNNSVKPNLLGFPQKKPEDSSIKTPLPLPYINDVGQ